MNRHRIVFSTLLVTLLMTSALLMGCGGGATTPAPAPTETAAPEPTDTQAPEPTATDTQAPPAEEPTETSPEEPAEEPTEESTEEPAAAVDGETLLQERCTQCHDIERTTQQQKDRAGWTQTVERMVNQGAQLNDEEQAILIDYLVETYGP